jgi:hypothetical protein
VPRVTVHGTRTHRASGQPPSHAEPTAC